MRGGVLQPELRSSSSARVSLSKKKSPGAARLFAWAALLCGGRVTGVSHEGYR